MIVLCRSTNDKRISRVHGVFQVKSQQDVPGSEDKVLKKEMSFYDCRYLWRENESVESEGKKNN
jgi:hypothetical protein